MKMDETELGRDLANSYSKAGMKLILNNGAFEHRNCPKYGSCVDCEYMKKTAASFVDEIKEEPYKLTFVSEACELDFREIFGERIKEARNNLPEAIDNLEQAERDAKTELAECEKEPRIWKSMCIDRVERDLSRARYEVSHIESSIRSNEEYLDAIIQ
ncbi:hypothetical protein P8631_12110 [Guyparkeria sp. 1SP6A2]|nr:hypothetical protein [Guyparkeria sp. 1SP6A2]